MDVVRYNNVKTALRTVDLSDFKDLHRLAHLHRFGAIALLLHVMPQISWMLLVRRRCSKVGTQRLKTFAKTM